MKLRDNRSRILLFSALLAGSVAPATAEDSAWSLSVSAVSSRSAVDLGTASDLGVGVDAEYRLSPLLGIGIAAYTNEFDDEVELDFFGLPLRLEQSFRMTPVLAGLRFHLTPDSRVDLYVGPVAGYVAMSELTLRLNLEIGLPEEVPSETYSLPLDDQWAWGATLGMNVRLGSGRSFLALGVTHLRTTLEIGSGGAELPHHPDLVPLSVHLGYGLRF